MTAPQIWPAESTSRGTSSVSISPKQRKASMGGGTVSYAGNSGVMGISIAKKNLGKFERIKERERRSFEVKADYV